MMLCRTPIETDSCNIFNGTSGRLIGQFANDRSTISLGFCSLIFQTGFTGVSGADTSKTPLRVYINNLTLHIGKTDPVKACVLRVILKTASSHISTSLISD